MFYTPPRRIPKASEFGSWSRYLTPPPMWEKVVTLIETTSDSPSKEREALEDIAYDCGTLEGAQRRAREALKD